MITADPAPRIAAILEPLRPYADEILIAADSRLDDETLARYNALADRLFRIEHVHLERHLAWLYSQCSGDWILRLDGDEVLSSALVRRLPELLASREVQQFSLRRAWLYRDQDHLLAGAPWSHDFVNRLIRNTGALRVPGSMHTNVDPAGPHEYLHEYLYHLDLLVNSAQQRRDKVVRYEVAAPGLRTEQGAPMNDAFYLPELREALDLAPVPDEDRELLARAVAASGDVDPEPDLADVPLVTLAEMDRSWERRAVVDSAYRARIEPCEQGVALAPASPGSLLLDVSNEGTERWPWRLDEEPLIRLGYRWLSSDGSLYTEECPRFPFSRGVLPGQRILTRLEVLAPVDPGDYLLEVDIVHENVRWFHCACRVPVRVAPQTELPAPGARLLETPPPRLQRWRRVRIPRTIHRVWLGDRTMPAEHQRFGETFAEHHRGWEMRLWTEADMPALEITAADRERARDHSEMSDLFRYEVLQRFGGIYVDTDVECLRPLTPLMRGVDAFAALEVPGRVGTAVLGAVPGHPVFARAARLARRTLGTGLNNADANGPYFLSLLLEQEPGAAILGARCFYPYLWDEPERRNETFPEAFAVHHWAMSWLPAGERSPEGQ